MVGQQEEEERGNVNGRNARRKENKKHELGEENWTKEIKQKEEKIVKRNVR